MPPQPDDLPRFHPLTPLRQWEGGDALRIVHAHSGTGIFGANGSGKTSGPAKHLALGYLAAGFGGLVLCAKVEERAQWENWARQTRREKDLVIIDAKGTWRFNPLDWEAQRKDEGGGYTINVVALLDELAQAIASSAATEEGGGGDNKFFQDALSHMCTNLVDLAQLSGVGVSLPELRKIVISAPQTPEEAASKQWQAKSDCALALKAADEATHSADRDTRADFEECRNYWLLEVPALSDRTKSIIFLAFSMLVRPFITRPLRRLFSSDTNIRPEDTFDGKIIIVDVPVQSYRLAGKICNLVWKYCFQIAALRRSQPTDGTYLRPVFLWADEYQNFISPFDFMFASVCRSASACMTVMVQNRESLKSVLGNDAMVDSLTANLSNLFFCQNSGTTNAWASRLIGEHWVNVRSISTNRGAGAQSLDPRVGPTAGVSMQDELRRYVDEAVFSSLRRGGAANDYKVEAVAYLGGHLFDGERPYKLLTFLQR